MRQSGLVAFPKRGSASHIRSLHRSAPISNLTFPTSTETISAVKFNLAESSVLASIGSDRTFTLYDIRTGKAERRVVMQVSMGARPQLDIIVLTQI